MKILIIPCTTHFNTTDRFLTSKFMKMPNFVQYLYTSIHLQRTSRSSALSALVARYKRFCYTNKII